MSILTLLQAQLAFGQAALLDHADFSLEGNERVGLIGRNGTGKSSLLKILAGQMHADDGTRQVQGGVSICYVAQEPELKPDDSIFEAVAAGLTEVRSAIDEYSLGEASAERMDALHSIIEQQSGWMWEQRVEEMLTRLGLSAEPLISTLSGGLKKRVALAQALVQKPDVLLLDEPTNHLDIDAIAWLEGLLQDFAGSIVVITHDRRFLDAVATRIVELDRGLLTSYPGNYAAYLAQKEAQLHQEALANARADKLLSEEEKWIRKGVEARRTRSVARIARLEKLRATRQARRDTIGQVKLAVDGSQLSGKIVSELDNVSFAYAGTESEQWQVRNLSAIFLRGDKVGLIGPNGVGKTTLLKLILGELEPQLGTAKQGSKLQVAYFDQLRDQINLEASLADFISPGSEWIEIAGKPKHVKSYLADFLFSPERANAPVKTLSGGERNRLLLARLFALPANVLVLDEPTNDLDMETLDMLEAFLQEYPGTVFLVSHDREFLNQVATSTIGYEGDTEGQGRWREYAGGVDDYLVQRARSLNAKGLASKNPSAKQTPANIETPPSAQTEGKTPVKRKLSFKEQRELDALPTRIEALETEQSQIRAALSDSSLFQKDPTTAAQKLARDALIEQELLECLERWEQLSA